MKLADLKRMAQIVSIRRLALAAKLEPVTLWSRIKRDSPELTDEESRAIKKAMKQAGITTIP